MIGMSATQMVTDENSLRKPWAPWSLLPMALLELRSAENTDAQIIIHRAGGNK